MWPPSWGSVAGREVTGAPDPPHLELTKRPRELGRPGCGREKTRVQDYVKDALRCAEDGKCHRR